MDHKQRFRKQDLNGKNIKTIQLRSSSLCNAFRVQKTVVIGKTHGERKRKEEKRCHEIKLVANNSLPRSSAITEDYRTSFQQIVTRPLQGKLHDIKRNTLKKRFKETLRLQRSSSQLTRI